MKIFSTKSVQAPVMNASTPKATAPRASSEALSVSAPKTGANAPEGVLAALAKPARGVTSWLGAAAHALAPATPALVALGALGCLVGAAQGYPCTGYDAKANQYFVNTNRTLYGVVHGWVSDCYDYSYACGQTCSSSGSGSSSSTTCVTNYCTATASDAPPGHFVGVAADRVRECGFTLTGSIPGDATVRIANALIERNLWVKISVNQLNLTDVTDPGILCLHAIS